MVGGGQLLLTGFRSGELLTRMTELAAGAGVILLMAVHTPGHRRHVRDRGDRFHLCDFAVAAFAFHPGL